MTAKRILQMSLFGSVRLARVLGTWLCARLFFWAAMPSCGVLRFSCALRPLWAAALGEELASMYKAPPPALRVQRLKAALHSIAMTGGVLEVGVARTYLAVKGMLGN